MNSMNRASLSLKGTIVPLFFGLIFGAFCHPVAQAMPVNAQAAGTSGSLFSAASANAITVPVAERGDASFLEMDRAKFFALASWKEFVCVIPNFPLAGAGAYTLRLEQ